MASLKEIITKVISEMKDKADGYLIVSVKLDCVQGDFIVTISRDSHEVLFIETNGEVFYDLDSIDESLAVREISFRSSKVLHN